jgi:hypothetical protein
MELFSALLLLIPLGLFIWIEVVFYRNYLKSVEQNPDQQTRLTVIWAFKTLLGTLPPALLTILIAFNIRGISSAYLDLLTGFIALSLAIGVPLGLLWGVSRGGYRNYQKTKAENQDRALGSVAITLFKTFLVVVFVFVFILSLIEALFNQGIILEILVYLSFGWVPILFQNVAQLFTHWKTVSIIGALSVLILIVFHWVMNWSYSKNPQPSGQGKNYWKVSWTAGLAGVVMVVFLSGYAFIGATRHAAGVIQEPIVHKLSGRAYDSDTKSNLHNVYLACKAYWADHGGEKSCDRPVFTLTTYGYIQSQDVRIEASGREKDFRGLATNINTDKWFWMDKLGSIQPFTPSKEKL